MIIRQAENQDFRELRQFYIRMNEVINRRTNLYNEENDYFPSDEMVLNAIEGGYQFIGIEDEKIVAAVIGNHYFEEAYLQAKWLKELSEEEFIVIHALRVLPEYGNRGLASQMVEYLIQHAKENQIKSLRLDVLEGYEGPARIYSRFGFQFVDTVEIFYADIGAPKRFRLMELLL